jgi:hypothetical protein
MSDAERPDALYGLNPFDHDPGAWGASLLYNAEVLLGVLDAAGARSVVEVGAYAGDLTELLLRWAASRDGARVAAVDPAPQPELEQLARESSELTLVRETSLSALEHLELSDAVILDGDHNYYTVSEELRRIEQRAGGASAPLPLILLHDVGWPHGRRDDYFDPEQIPAEYRQPIEPGGGLYPGVEGTRWGGLPYANPAAREGGPRNGVRTAAEDFVAERPGLRLAVVPSFFGLGIVYAATAPYAPALEEFLAPWLENRLLERLEANRVLHLASSHVQMRRAQHAEHLLQQHRELLERMMNSRAVAAAELFLRLRQRGKPIFSREEIRRLISQ